MNNYVKNIKDKQEEIIDNAKEYIDKISEMFQKMIVLEMLFLSRIFLKSMVLYLSKETQTDAETITNILFHDINNTKE
jgi:hypothetical protein